MKYDEVVREKFRELAEGFKDRIVIAKSDRTAKNIDFKVIPPEWFKLPSKEYAIARGDEVIMECEFMGCKAHVFTPSPYTGSITLSEVLNLNLSTISERSIFYGSLNALMRYLGLIDRTVHCRGSDPVKCAEELVNTILGRYGDVPVLLVGYQPAMAKALAKLSQVYITDMSDTNVGRKVSNFQVLDHAKNLELMELVDVALVTGSTVVNSTLWPIYEKAAESGTKLILYGVTGAGVAKILNIERFCLCGL